MKFDIEDLTPEEEARRDENIDKMLRDQQVATVAAPLLALFPPFIANERAANLCTAFNDIPADEVAGSWDEVTGMIYTRKTQMFTANPAEVSAAAVAAMRALFYWRTRSNLATEVLLAAMGAPTKLGRKLAKKGGSD